MQLEPRALRSIIPKSPWDWLGAAAAFALELRDDRTLGFQAPLQSLPRNKFGAANVSSSGAGAKEGENVTETVTSESDLNGLRILVVEDEAAISLLLEDMLLDFGCEVIGPAARLSAALEAVSREQVDLAILDVNVAGEPIYPVAEALAQRSIPFVFSTGYGSAGIRDAFRDRPVLQKPFAQNDLKQKLIMARHKSMES
jgi:CheY-like chemotaxis protein